MPCACRCNYQLCCSIFYLFLFVFIFYETIFYLFLLCSYHSAYGQWDYGFLWLVPLKLLNTGVLWDNDFPTPLSFLWMNGFSCILSTFKVKDWNT